jgi:CheY-like chemotaxis protein
MPNLTGPRATRIIRTQHGYRGMIVALTGSVLDDEVQDFKNSGATLVLAKPMQQTDLERILFGYSPSIPPSLLFLSSLSPRHLLDLRSHEQVALRD